MIMSNKAQGGKTTQSQGNNGELPQPKQTVAINRRRSHPTAGPGAVPVSDCPCISAKFRSKGSWLLVRSGWLFSRLFLLKEIIGLTWCQLVSSASKARRATALPVISTRKLETEQAPANWRSAGFPRHVGAENSPHEGDKNSDNEMEMTSEGSDYQLAV